MKSSSTSNYKKFSFLPFNRDYEVRSSLVRSFNKYGWLVPIVCVETDLFGKKQLYIADGQHRFATARFLGIPIEYIVIDHSPRTKEHLVNCVSMLNSSSTPWSIKNYVESFCYLGNKDYVYLDKVHGETGISHTTLSNIYLGNMSRKAGNVVKDGSFRVLRKKEGDNIVKCISQLNNVVRFNGRMCLGFAHFHRSLDGGFNVKEFSIKLESNLPLLDDISEDILYSRVFDRIHSS